MVSARPGDGEDAVRRARRSLALVARDPTYARASAAGVLADSDSPEARCVAWLALGLAAHECGGGTLARLERAIQIAWEADLPRWLSHARSSKLGMLAYRGGTTAAAAGSGGPADPDGVHPHLRRGVALTQAGWFEAAATEFGRALVRLPDGRDPQHEVGLLSNRGLVRLWAGDLSTAEADLSLAASLAHQHGLLYLRAVTRQNLGRLAIRRGDLSLALAEFDMAGEWLTARRARALALDRAEALVEAGAYTEARDALRAVAGTSHGSAAELASGELVRAHVELRGGDPAAAIRRASRLRDMFGPASGWSAMARRIEWSARSLVAPSPSPHPVRRPRGARRRESQGITPRLAAFAQRWRGLRRAVADSDPVRALYWLERGHQWRLYSEARPHPPLDRYRQVCAQLNAIPRESGRDPRWDGLRSEAERLGALIRYHRPLVQDDSPVPHPLAAEELAAALGDRALVTLTELDGELLAITLRSHRFQLHRLGRMSHAADATAGLLLAARRWSLDRASPRTVASHAALLHRLVVRPLSRELGDAPLVLVPTGPLGSVPWGLLPGTRDRPVSVALSAATWLRCWRRARTGGRRRATLVAGPELLSAEEEVTALRGVYPGATLLTGDRARSEELIGELGRCDVAHIAAHGLGGTGAPLPGVLLADGPLTAYDLERARRFPPLTVLACCDGGRTRARPYVRSPLGLAEAAVTGWSGTVIASVLPVRDGDLPTEMVRAHAALAAAVPAADVVARHLAHAGFVCLGAG